MTAASRKNMSLSVLNLLALIEGMDARKAKGFRILPQTGISDGEASLMGTSAKSRSNQMANAAFAPYIMALGRVAHSWNYLQESLGDLFGTLSGMEDRIRIAIWHSTTNDRAQREMLRAVVRVTSQQKFLELCPQSGGDLEWLLNHADKVANKRNDAIHAPVSLGIGGKKLEIRSSRWTGNPRALNLADKDILAEFAWYEATADTLTNFARKVSNCLLFGPDPWPDRPLLPTLQPKTTERE